MPEQSKLDWNALMEEALNAPGHLGDVYNRFHDYSLINNLLFRMQGVHEPVASYKRWQILGRQVMRGAQAKSVIVPLLVKDRAAEPEADRPDEQAETEDQKRARIARLVGFKVVRGVFALSDTEGRELPPVQFPSWDLDAALAKLAIRQVPFDEMNGNVQGYSRGLDIAINPVAAHPKKTLFHEVGHVVLGHTMPHALAEYATHRGIKEFQAEATAYLTLHELNDLDDETATHSRGYIQHWLQREHPGDDAIRQVFRATDAILRAGRGGNEDGRKQL